jgi:hypothetical protein
MTQYKEGEITTTRGSFPDHNITHKPKRLQGDNIRLAQNVVEVATINGDITTTVNDVPTVLTLERAIEYYMKHSSDGSTARLYQATVKWLTELLTSKNKPVTPNVGEASETRVNVEAVIEALKRKQSLQKEESKGDDISET